MVAFLMLGIIPGTNIQISFENWLFVMYVLAALLMLRMIVRSQLIPIVLIVLAIRGARMNLSSLARLA